MIATDTLDIRTASPVPPLPRPAQAWPENKPLPPERLAPHDADFEESVLGAVLLNANALPLVRTAVAVDDFFILKHQRIWSALLAIADRGDAVDGMMLIRELRARNWLDEIGGREYLDRLINLTPRFPAVVAYASVIKRYAIRRRLITAAEEIVQAARDETMDLPAILDKTERVIAEPILAFREKEAVVVSSREVGAALRANIDDWYAHPQDIRGWRTGIGDMDNAMGGIENGSVFLLFGHTGQGKTELLIQMILSLLPQLKEADKKSSALIVPTEMTPEQYQLRMIAFKAHTDTQTIKSGRYKEEKYLEIAQAGNELVNLPYDYETRDSTPEKLYALCEARKRRGMTMLFIDGLHDLAVDPAFAGSGVYERVTHNIEQVHKIAHDLDIPVFCTAHINRESSKQQQFTREPHLQHLAGSSRIEQLIAYALCLYRPGDFVQKGMLEELPKGFTDNDQASIRLVKSRFGNNGHRTMLTFKHTGRMYGFFEQEEQRSAPPSRTWSDPSDKDTPV